MIPKLIIYVITFSCHLTSLLVIVIFVDEYCGFSHLILEISSISLKQISTKDCVGNRFMGKPKQLISRLRQVSHEAMKLSNEKLFADSFMIIK